jgi:hypothetical protein
MGYMSYRACSSVEIQDMNQLFTIFAVAVVFIYHSYSIIGL